MTTIQKLLYSVAHCANVYWNLSVTIIYMKLQKLRWTGIAFLAHHYYYSIANSIMGRHAVISSDSVVQPCMPC